VTFETEAATVHLRLGVPRPPNTALSGEGRG